jgi:hypothetical protein
MHGFGISGLHICLFKRAGLHRIDFPDNDVQRFIHVRVNIGHVIVHIHKKVASDKICLVCQVFQVQCSLPVRKTALPDADGKIRDIVFHPDMSQVKVDSHLFLHALEHYLADLSGKTEKCFPGNAAFQVMLRRIVRVKVNLTVI